MTSLRHIRAQPSSVARPRSEAGETLVEITMTVFLLGVGVVTVVSLMWTMARVTGMHRATTTANTWVHNIGETVINPTDTPYAHCASTYTSLAVPSGYDADVMLVERLSDPTAQSPTWTPMPPGCVDDGGVQRVTIEAWDVRTPQQRETLQVVKRDTQCQNTPGVDC